MGFGHRVYKSYDPRAKIIKRTADEVFEVTGKNPLLDIALELERIALEDEYFVTRRLYPNVDFYSGLIYQAMGFPVTMFPVLFAIPRTSGWIAQWEEMLLDPEQKIARPKQIYIGPNDATTCRTRRTACRCDAAYGIVRSRSRSRSRWSVRAAHLSVRSRFWPPGSCTDTAKRDRTATSERSVAPTARPSKIAPTSDSGIAPTNESHPIAPTPVLRQRESVGTPAQAGGASAPSVWEPRDRRDPQYIIEQLKKAGIEAKEQPFIGMTPLGEVDGQRHRHDPGRRPERLVLASHFDTKLFASSDSSAPTTAPRQPRRCSSWGASSRPAERADDRAAVPRRRRGADARSGAAPTTPTAAATTCRRRRRAGRSRRLKALVLLDMIGDRDLVIKRDANSTPWLVDVIWSAAARLGHGSTFSNQLTTIEDDHIPFLRAGVAAADIIDLENPTWHTPQDDLDHVSAKSLQVVGDVVVAVDPATPLLYVLSDDLELRGPKFGCGLGQCGACTVIVNGQATRSCVTPVSTVGQNEITTLEGLGTAERRIRFSRRSSTSRRRSAASA